jgi:O-antigen/teichoic acid export membrane protein
MAIVHAHRAVMVREDSSSQRPVPPPTPPMPVGVSTARNILSNLLGNIVYGVTGFILAPIMIHGLGDLHYGMWALALSLVGSYGLIDTGMRITMQRFVARFKGMNQRESLNQVLATTFALMVAASLLLCTLTLFLILVIPSFFHVAVSSQPLFRRVLALLGLSVAFIFPARALTTYLSGIQRFDLFNLGSTLASLTKAVLIILALRSGFGLLGVAAVTLTTEALSLPFYWFLLKRADPGASLHWRNVQALRIRELAGFSFFAYLGNAGDYLRFSMDSAVISRFLGVALVTPFSVAGRLMDNFRALIATFNSPLMPRMTEIDSQDRVADLREMFVRTTRMTSLISFFIASLVLLDGKSLLRLWLGERFVSSYGLLLVLTLGHVLLLAQAPSGSLMFAKGRHRLLGWWTLGEGAVNLFLSIFWARRYGLVGVALGTTVPILVTGLFIQPLYVARLLELPLVHYIRGAFAKPLLACGLFLLISSLAFSAQNQFSIPSFALILACQCTLFALLVYAAGLTHSERQLARQQWRGALILWQRLRTN